MTPLSKATYTERRADLLTHLENIPIGHVVVGVFGQDVPLVIEDVALNDASST